jgi:hypothetical protein
LQPNNVLKLLTAEYAEYSLRSQRKAKWESSAIFSSITVLTGFAQDRGEIAAA